LRLERNRRPFFLERNRRLFDPETQPSAQLPVFQSSVKLFGPRVRNTSYIYGKSMNSKVLQKMLSGIVHHMTSRDDISFASVLKKNPDGIVTMVFKDMGWLGRVETKPHNIVRRSCLQCGVFSVLINKK
jgi:hypothetical protein